MSSVREQMLRDAIAKVEQTTLEAVAALLPGDFELDADELAAATSIPEDVEAQIVECDNELIRLRQEARTKHNELVTARHRLGDAIRVVNQNGRTPESVARDYIRTSQDERARIAELSRGHGGEPLTSAVDQIAKYRRGGNVNVGDGRRGGGFRRVPASADPGTVLSATGTPGHRK